MVVRIGSGRLAVRHTGIQRQRDAELEVLSGRTDAIHQRRMQRVEPLPPAEHRRLGRARKRSQGRDGAIERWMTRSAYRTGHLVQQRARRFLTDGLRNVFELPIHHISAPKSE